MNIRYCLISVDEAKEKPKLWALKQQSALSCTVGLRQSLGIFLAWDRVDCRCRDFCEEAFSLWRMNNMHNLTPN
jgi:hypothetical protein